MTTQNERAAFEAWHKRTYGRQPVRSRLGSYQATLHNDRWMIWKAVAALKSQDREDAEPILTKKHTGLMVDYSGLLMQASNALVTGSREPALAGMLRQLQEHLTELGLRWHEGDTTVVDEFLQLYCIASESRRRIEGERK